MTQQVIFKINDEDFGMDIMHVNEIIRMQSLTAMPNTSPIILGVTNIRGEIVPIVSFKQIFKMEESKDDESTRIIVATIEEKTYGFKVDQVSEIIRIDQEQIEEASKMSDDKENNYILGIAKVEERLIKLIDLEKILK